MPQNNVYKVTDAQKSAIDALQKFYSIIVAAAFTGSLLKFLDTTSNADSVTKIFETSVLFAAFVATIVPFYHGMERYLFETHIARRDIYYERGGKPSPLLFDVFAFIVLGGILFAMGRNISDPFSFLVLWVSLLAVDIVWVFIVHLRHKTNRPLWLFNNLIWGLAAVAIWYVIDCYYEQQTQILKVLFIGFCEFGRSYVDYRTHWKFYFPDDVLEDPGGS
jgi:hypothetical protein